MADHLAEHLPIPPAHRRPGRLRAPAISAVAVLALALSGCGEPDDDDGDGGGTGYLAQQLTEAAARTEPTTTGG